MQRWAVTRAFSVRCFRQCGAAGHPLAPPLPLLPTPLPTTHPPAHTNPNLPLSPAPSLIPSPSFQQLSHLSTLGFYVVLVPTAPMPDLCKMCCQCFVKKLVAPDDILLARYIKGSKKNEKGKITRFIRVWQMKKIMLASVSKQRMTFIVAVDILTAVNGLLSA